MNSVLKDLNIETLIGWVEKDTLCSDWLNTFYSLWISDAGVEEVVESAFVPNQNNEFVQFGNIHFDNNIEIELKEILTLLGGKIKKQLLKQDIISFNQYLEEHADRIKTNELCSDQIDIKISQLLSKEAIDREERKEDTQKIFNRLTNWLLSTPEKSKEWFGTLYSKRICES